MALGDGEADGSAEEDDEEEGDGEALPESDALLVVLQPQRVTSIGISTLAEEGADLGYLGAPSSVTRTVTESSPT